MKFYFENKDAAIAFLEAKKEVLRKKIVSKQAEILDIPNRLALDLETHTNRCWFDRAFGLYSARTVKAHWDEEESWYKMIIRDLNKDISCIASQQDKIRDTEGFTFVEIEE